MLGHTTTGLDREVPKESINGKGLIEVSRIRTRRRPRTARRTAQGRSVAALGLSGVVPEHSYRTSSRVGKARTPRDDRGTEEGRVRADEEVLGRSPEEVR